MRDWLEQPLRAIDSELPPAAVPTDLSKRVLEQAARVQVRSRRRTASVAVTAFLLLVAVGSLLTHRNRHIRDADLASLRRDTEAQALVVNHLLDAEQRRDASRRLADATARLQFRASIALAREQAALTMVYLADRELAHPALVAAARHDYQRVIALFPETFWADRARHQLDRMTE